MSLHPISLAGHRLVGQLTPSHTLRFQKTENGLAVALQLLSSTHPGAPVVDAEGNLVGFISEFDILAALEEGRNLSQLQVEEIMVSNLKVINSSTLVAEAARMMKDNNILVLPVEDDRGVLLGSLTRQDLLRAWIAWGLGTETK